MTKKKAIDIMLSLQAEYFYAFKDMPETLFDRKVKNFMEALDGYTDDEIDTALKMLIRESKNCPTSANFVEVIERNREVFQPSAEELWDAIWKCMNSIKAITLNFKTDGMTPENYKMFQKLIKETYETLPVEVKEYYKDFSGFIEVVYSQKLDIEKAKFLKNFPLFIERKRTKAENERLGGKKNG